MTPAEFLDGVPVRLEAAGYAVERLQLSCGAAVVGRRRLFRVRWFLTQLKVSVVVAAVDHASPAAWEAFLVEAFGVARGYRGGLPNGLQSGVGAVPVLAAMTVDPAAADLATRLPRREWFTGISMPALVDLGTGRVNGYDGRILVGGVYAPFLREQRSLVTSLATT